jgi:hypothetical protein
LFVLAIQSLPCTVPAISPMNAVKESVSKPGRQPVNP